MMLLLLMFLLFVLLLLLLLSFGLLLLIFAVDLLEKVLERCMVLRSWLRIHSLLVRVVVDPAEPGATLADVFYDDEVVAVSIGPLHPVLEP